MQLQEKEETLAARQKEFDQLEQKIANINWEYDRMKAEKRAQIRAEMDEEIAKLKALKAENQGAVGAEQKQAFNLMGSQSSVQSRGTLASSTRPPIAGVPDRRMSHHTKRDHPSGSFCGGARPDVKKMEVKKLIGLQMRRLTTMVKSSLQG